jgi:uncharacterized protein
MAGHLAARWCAWDNTGLEEAKVAMTDAGWTAKGDIAAEPGVRAWCRYEVKADDRMRTRSVAVTLADGRSLRLEADGEGHWTRDGKAAPELEGAIDVDLSGTPVTNTLPVLRLGLGIGDKARIVCAYVDLASLAVRPEAQTYARLGSAKYHFQSAAHGFARDIEFGGDGLVVSYPGMFRRVG